jgi:hypothetical protein
VATPKRAKRPRSGDGKTESNMNNSAPIEPDMQIFTGTIKSWRSDYGELVTDSGIAIPLLTHGLPALAVGSRLTVVARKLKPVFQIERIVRRE